MGISQRSAWAKPGHCPREGSAFIPAWFNFVLLQEPFCHMEQTLIQRNSREKFYYSRSSEDPRERSIFRPQEKRRKKERKKEKISQPKSFCNKRTICDLVGKIYFWNVKFFETRMEKKTRNRQSEFRTLRNLNRSWTGTRKPRWTGSVTPVFLDRQMDDSIPSCLEAYIFTQRHFFKISFPQSDARGVESYIETSLVLQLVLVLQFLL